jgi:hypothetical protein
LAQPELRLAGLRFNPRTSDPSRGRYCTSLKLKQLPDGKEIAVRGLPPNAKIRFPRWSAEPRLLLSTSATQAKMPVCSQQTCWRGTTITEAARRAGYSEKNLAQSGHQALKAIRLRMHELMDGLGLTGGVLIEKHLVPLLWAKTTKFFQYQGKVRDQRIVAENRARPEALDMVFKLKGSCAAGKPNLAAPTGVKVIVMDVPGLPRTVAKCEPAIAPAGASFLIGSDAATSHRESAIHGSIAANLLSGQRASG